VANSGELSAGGGSVAQTHKNTYIAQRLRKIGWGQSTNDYTNAFRISVVRSLASNRLPRNSIRKPFDALVSSFLVRSAHGNSFVVIACSVYRDCRRVCYRRPQAGASLVLGRYAAYYNESRIHRSLDKDVPFDRAIERFGVITSQPVLGGLHHQYCRI